VDKILEFLQVGSKTNFLLNTLILTDTQEWKNDYLNKLINLLSEIIDDSFEENRLLLSPNPMMSIALTVELLIKISDSRKRFKNMCNSQIASLLELGKVYNSKITDEEYFRELIMDVDFQNRTVLKIITQC